MTKLLTTCVCANGEQIVEAADVLPERGILCHCNVCRYTSGILFASCLRLKEQPTKLGHLTQYQSSNGVEKYFCKTCGSCQFFHNLPSQEWHVCTGTIDGVIDQAEPINSLISVIRHEYIADTTDGGLAVCLVEIKNQRIPLHPEGPGTSPVASWPQPRAEEGADEVDRTIQKVNDRKTQFSPDKLHAGCHCGGVSFHVTRPNEESTRLSSPWPDLLRPYHCNDSANPDDVKWWLRGSRYLAGTCACRSCRLASGFPVQAWAFVPRKNLHQPDGASLDFGAGTLASIESSKDVFRHFCAVCGATVFWRCKARPELIDVSVGLLRAPEGSRAGTWLDWHTERVSFEEDAFEKDLIRALGAGLESLHI